MNPLRIFVARKIPEIGIQRLHEHFASAHAFDLDIWQDDRPPTRDIMLTKVQGASGLLTLLIDKVVFDQTRALDKVSVTMQAVFAVDLFISNG